MSPSEEMPELPFPGYLRAGTVEELRSRGCLVIRAADRPVAVFDDRGTPRAIDNRCPHLGFPLSRGSIRDGIITCPWHNARFDAASGCTFDLWADDVPAFDVQVRDGVIWVASHPRGADPAAAALLRLREGMEHNLSLICAKAVLALDGHGVAVTDVVREAALFGSEGRDDWSAGLTILTAMANILPALSARSGYLALFSGIRHVASDCDGRPARRERRPLDGSDASLPRLGQWLEYWTLVRHRDAAERTLLTAVERGASPAELAAMVFTAATGRFFADGGHMLDFCNKAFELLDLIGWEQAPRVLPAVVRPLVAARGSEETNAWRYPLDLVPLVHEADGRLVRALQEGQGCDWAGEESLADAILGDSPRQILDAIVEAARDGARPHQLGKALAYAAALRVARFGPTNELSDWIAALHTFTYCNAIHQVLKRFRHEPSLPAPAPPPAPEVGAGADACGGPAVPAAHRIARGVLHGAMAVYLDRFLNVPPTRLPGERESATEVTVEGPEAQLEHLLQLFDARQNGDAPARLVHHYLESGHPAAALIEALATAVVREDADFHTYQMLEASLRQYEEWGDTRPGRNILIALTRYIAAHSPTQRAALQTATTALRLHRGEELHD